MHEMLNKRLGSILLVLVVAIFAGTAVADQVVVDQVAMGTRGMVTSAHPLGPAQE